MILYFPVFLEFGCTARHRHPPANQHHKQSSDMLVSTSRFLVVLAHALILHLANRACTSQECFGARTPKQLKDAP